MHSLLSEKEDKKKVKKAKKDKNAPKRNSSSYVLFGADMRETIKKENPDIKPSEVMKELGTELECHLHSTRHTYLLV